MTEFEGGMHVYYQAARAFKALLSRHIIDKQKHEVIGEMYLTDRVRIFLAIKLSTSNMVVMVRPC